MRLKSLELSGYKTFASKTTFEFPDRITAIVGPNGSGKSNIVDALRWVLGEQSYSLLRGRKTVDMIFSGSENRSRSGMAATTVLFDNSVNWLPIEFSEVAITRRAYRDGQNEYLINGQKARLRDISELLGGAGLTDRTYTIVGQGLVDVALSLRADERRKLFEDAAGIGVYRSRRDEALRRLDITRRNLERVQDILTELRPRLQSLERQARRAQEFEQVKVDLQVMLREWYGYHWHRAQQELKISRQAARTQENNLEMVRRRQSDLSRVMKDLRDRSHLLRGKLNSWHRELSQLHTRREHISRELAVAEERQRALVDRQDSLNANLNRFEQEIRLHQERLHQSQIDVERLQSQVLEAQEELKISQQDLRNKEIERQIVETELQNVHRSLSQLNPQRIEHTTRKVDLETRIKNQDGVLEQARLELADSERSVKLASEQVEVGANELVKGEDDRKRAQLDLADIQVKIGQAEGDRKEKLELLSSQRTEAARIQAQIDVLEGAKESLAGYTDGARLLLEAAQKGHIAGIQGALSSQLDVSAEYETAITAALGEYVDGVLSGPEIDLEEVLKKLQDESVRASLLPLDSIVPPETIPPPQDPDCFGLAADLVKTSPELRPLVDILLGNVWVVRDRGKAIRLLKENSLGAGLRIVSLLGEVFRADGPISAGQGGMSGKIGHVRQHRELTEGLNKTRRKLAVLDTKLLEDQKRIDALQHEQSGLQNALTEARIKEEDLRREHQRLIGVVEEANRQRDWHASQLNTLQVEFQEITEAIRLASAEESRLGEEITRMEERQHALQDQLTSLTLDDYQTQVSHWVTQIAVGERAVLDARSRVEERQTVLAEVQKRFTETKTQLELISEEIASLKGQYTGLRAQESEVSEKIDSLQTLTHPAETELEYIERDQDNQQAAEEKARRELTISEHHYTQTQINLAKNQEALDALRHRIEEDFGLVAFEYEEEVVGPTPLPLGDMVEILPHVRTLSPGVEKAIRRQRAQLRRIGAINPEAQKEYQEVKERYEFTVSQIDDLQSAETDIDHVISELDKLMHQEFHKTFEAVASEFKGIFNRLFGGGSANLVLTNPDDLNETGVDIEARLPGRRTQELSLLSGGERSLTACALIFALLKVSPTPFCVLDEVDAMLDEANVNRFAVLLRELSQNTQFVIITHNRYTVQVADTIYGITMGRDSTSQVLGLRLDEVMEKVGGLS